jgi:hypothetical protein
LLLLLWRPSLELLLLWSLRLLELLLLSWVSCELRLLRLCLLLPETLRLTRVASKLWLHWASSKASRLRSKLALEACRLSILLLLLLAILGLSRSGAVAAP